MTTQFHRLTGSSSDASTQKNEEPTNEMQVTELSTQPLDGSLFEVPENFRKVEQIRRTPVFSYWRRLLGWLDYYWARLKHAI